MSAPDEGPDMLQFRVREWGQGEWSYIFIHGELCEQVQSIIGSPLSDCSLHVQILNEEEEWEDFE